MTPLTLILALLAASFTAIAGEQSASTVFAGTTPCGDRMKTLFQLPSSDALRWKLTLENDNKTGAPARYKLECQCVAMPGTSMKTIFTARREGSCKLTKGTTSDTEAAVIELENAVSAVQITTNILHLLDRDRSLMVGTDGFSYTLNQVDAAEKPGDLGQAVSRPSVSYTNSPLAQGPRVFGIFGGRTPCIGIARELGMPEDSGCLKTKWRVTLFQDPETKTPTTYKIENSFTRGHAREGNWSISNGTAENPNALVYSLAATATEAELCLLKGDDNVLFLLNHRREPLVGHADFSYTLNRKR